MRRRFAALFLACLLLAGLSLPAAAAEGDYQRGYDQGYADAQCDDYFELPYPDEYWTNDDYSEGYDAGVEAALRTLPDYQRGYADGCAAGLRGDYWALTYPEAVECLTNETYRVGYDDGVNAVIILPPVVRYGGREGAVNVMVNGQCIDFGDDVWPTVTGGRTLAPARAVLEALGAEVEYDLATRTVSARRDGVLLLHTIGTEFVERYPDGDTASEPEILEMDCPSRLISGRTMVPVRFFADALDVYVLWDGENRTAVLLDPAALSAEWDGQLTVLDTVLDAQRLLAAENLRMTIQSEASVTLLDSLNGDETYDGALEWELLFGPDGMQEWLSWDLSGLFDTLRSQYGGDAYLEEMAQLLERSSAEVRWDAASGKAYVGGQLIDDLAGMQNVWLAEDVGAAQSLVDVPADVPGLVLNYAVQGVWEPLSIWATAEGTLESVTAVLGDDTFTATGSGWRWDAAAADAAVQSYLDDLFWGLSASGGHTADLSLTVARNGTVDFAADVAGPDFTLATALDSAADDGSWSLDLHVRNELKLNVSVRWELDPSADPPETTPPTGGTVPDEFPETMI